MEAYSCLSLEPQNSIAPDTRFQQAIELFHQAEYYKSFLQFAKLYEEGFQPETIMDLLVQSFYAPNEEEMKAVYQRNLALLQAYPYCWDKEFSAFDDLNFLLFPVCDGVYFGFDRQTRRFIAPYKPEAERTPDYFFATLDKQLFVEDEVHYYHLKFLNDTVRRSEDYAGDNHIYLYYENPDYLAALMLVTDLEALLDQQKFVFLIGTKNRARYPINFKKQFGIDYKSMKPQLLRIEELNRFCFWYKHAHSGTVFSLGVLGANEHTIVYSGHDFHTYSVIQGETMYFTKEFQNAMRDMNGAYTVSKLKEICEKDGNDIHLANLSEFLDWLDNTYGVEKTYTIGFLFRAFFLFLHWKEKGCIRTRIAPVIIFDPHMWDSSVFIPLVQSFPYHAVLTCFREPIRTFASCYWRGLVVWNKFQTQFVLASDYTYTQFLNQALKARYYGYRFEDLKLHPEQMCRKICKFLNIPYDKKMLRADAVYHGNDGKDVRGFETTAVNRNIDSVFSEFDRIRLQIFYEPIHKYYGYPTFDSEEYKLPDEEINQLFSYPFRFERHYREFYRQYPEEAELRDWIGQVLAYRLSKEMLSQITFPKLLALED